MAAHVVVLHMWIKAYEREKMMDTQKKRAVIVLDVEMKKDTDLVISLHKIIKQAAEGLVGAINENPLRIKVEHHLAGVMAAERRGETGSIDEIVFRGARGKNSNLKIPRTTTQGIVISAGCKKRLQSLRKRILTYNDASKILQHEADYIMDAVLKTGRTKYSPFAQKIMEQEHV